MVMDWCNVIFHGLISFFQKASGSFSFSNCMYAHAAHADICINTNLNDSSSFPSFASPRTEKFISDIYTNNRYRGLFFLDGYYPGIFQHFFYSRSLDRCLVLADSTMECFHFNASKDTYQIPQWPT